MEGVKSRIGAMAVGRNTFNVCCTGEIRVPGWQPLRNEFPLKPGHFTMARFSKVHDTAIMVQGTGEMLRAPRAFSPISGATRLDSLIDEVLDILRRTGLEAQSGIIYSEHQPALRKLADLLNTESLCNRCHWGCDN